MFRNNTSKKQTILPYEELEDGCVYAFTYNPIDQPKPGALGELEWFDEMRQFFYGLQYSKYRLYTEVSKTGRWHFHGLIKITDRLRFTIREIGQLMTFGNLCMKRFKTTDDHMNWLAYCNKQQNELQDYLTGAIYCTIDPKVLKNRNEDGIILIDSL